MMNNEVMQGLNLALANVAHHMKHIPNLECIVIRKNVSGPAKQHGAEPEPGRTRPIKKYSL